MKQHQVFFRICSLESTMEMLLKQGNHFLNCLVGCLRCYRVALVGSRCCASSCFLSFNFANIHIWLDTCRSCCVLSAATVKSEEMNCWRLRFKVSSFDFNICIHAFKPYPTEWKRCNDKRNCAGHRHTHRSKEKRERNLIASERTNKKKSSFNVDAYKIMSLNLFNIRFEYFTRIGLLLLCINAVFIQFTI